MENEGDRKLQELKFLFSNQLTIVYNTEDLLIPAERIIKKRLRQKCYGLYTCPNLLFIFCLHNTAIIRSDYIESSGKIIN